MWVELKASVFTMIFQKKNKKKKFNEYPSRRLNNWKTRDFVCLQKSEGSWSFGMIKDHEKGGVAPSSRVCVALHSRHTCLDLAIGVWGRMQRQGKGGGHHASRSRTLFHANAPCFTLAHVTTDLRVGAADETLSKTGARWRKRCQICQCDLTNVPNMRMF